jgi:DNA-binding PadR family transcriptional regulator
MKNRVHLSGEQHSFWENREKNIVSNHDFVSEEKARLLKACLDIAILTEMAKRSVVSASDIIVLIKKNCGIQISPGTVYPVLYRLERRGYSRLLPDRRKMFYILTDSGKKALEDLQQRFEDMQSFIICLVNR